MMKFILPKFLLRVERWKWNSEHRVFVSNMGHFKNEFKQDLPVRINNSGYCKVKTNCGYVLAHRMVLLTWRPIPNAEALTVDHLNHNKRDNSIYNLEWVTQEENLHRAKRDFIKDSTPQSVIKKTLSGKEKQQAVTEMVNTININIDRVKCGKDIYVSYMFAAKKLMAESNDNFSNTTVEKVAKRIRNAAVTGKKYCNKKWEII